MKDRRSRPKMIAFMSTELEAYSDDSYEPHNDFVIGGFVGPAVEWLKVEQPWREALQKAGLTEYKARDCEQGDNEFKGRTDRGELQEKFISLIRSIEVGGSRRELIWVPMTSSLSESRPPDPRRIADTSRRFPKSSKCNCSSS
jgi:hypothetical protein